MSVGGGTNAIHREAIAKQVLPGTRLAASLVALLAAASASGDTVPSGRGSDQALWAHLEEKESHSTL